MAFSMKTILVQLDKYSRKISFQAEASESELCVLRKKVREKFEDLINPDDKIIFKAKDEDFGGLFVDFFEPNIHDNSVFKVVVEKAKVSLYCVGI